MPLRLRNKLLFRRIYKFLDDDQGSGKTLIQIKEHLKGLKSRSGVPLKTNWTTQQISNGLSISQVFVMREMPGGNEWSIRRGAKIDEI